MCVSSVGALPHRFFVQGTAVKNSKGALTLRLSRTHSKVYLKYAEAQQ